MLLRVTWWLARENLLVKNGPSCGRVVVVGLLFKVCSEEFLQNFRILQVTGR